MKDETLNKLTQYLLDREVAFKEYLKKDTFFKDATRFEHLPQYMQGALRELQLLSEFTNKLIQDTDPKSEELIAWITKYINKPDLHDVPVVRNKILPD